MKVVITGATGCVGQNLVKKLVQDSDIQVTALGRNKTIGSTLETKNSSFFQTDICDSVSLKKLFKDQDVAIHCAALASPWGPHKRFQSTNVDGTQTVLNAIKTEGWTLIECYPQASSFEPLPMIL